MKKAVVLLSGGLDSAVAFYLARKNGFRCHCLIFDYGQRHKKEIQLAKMIAKKTGTGFQVLKISLPWKGSSLLDKSFRVPWVTKSQSHPLTSLASVPSVKKASISARGGTGKVTIKIPNTYVPGRNIIFLSFALSCAEALGAGAIFIGAHVQDYSGYPDCRKDFFDAFRNVIKRGTRSGVQASGVKILTPLINKKKSQIIKLGKSLGVPFELTWSCYKGANKPCGRCDSCAYRAKGFFEAGVNDPAI